MLALGIDLSRRVLPYTWLELLHHSEAPLEVPGSHGVLINEILYQIKNSDKTVWVDSTRHYFRWLRFQKLRSTDSESHANPLYSAHAICLKSVNPEMPSSKNRIFVSNNDRHRYSQDPLLSKPPPEPSTCLLISPGSPPGPVVLG